LKLFEKVSAIQLMQKKKALIKATQTTLTTLNNVGSVGNVGQKQTLFLMK
jgi:hypothetical protein